MSDAGVEPVGCPYFDHHRRYPDEASRYADYAALQACPVGRSDAHGGFWVFARHADIVDAETDWATFRAGHGVLLPEQSDRRIRQVGLEQDPPEHTPYRRLYAELLSRPRVRAAEAFIRDLARRRVEDLAAEPGGDFVARVAVPVPVEVVAHLLGLDESVIGRVRALSEDAWAALSRPRPAPGTAQADGTPASLSRLLRDELDARRLQPSDDYLTTLVDATFDGEPIPPMGMASFLVGAVIAGHETTLSAATNLAYQLGLDPALQQRLVDEPHLIGRAVDESLRHRSPVQNFFRTVAQDVTRHGVELRQGDRVMLLYGAANRDPEQFSDPDRYDLDRYDSDRDAKRHLAYGYGIHRCVGAYLAEVELHAVAEALLRYELTVEGEPTFVPTAHGAFLAIESLPVTLRPRA